MRNFVNGLLGAILCIGIIVLFAILSGRSSEKASGSAVTNQREPEIRLVSSRNEFSPGGEYLEIFGQVENLTGRPIENLEAVGAIYDAAGQLIRTDDALVEYNPVMPGQTSPFHIMIRWNPLAKSSGVQFKRLGGGVVETAR